MTLVVGAGAVTSGATTEPTGGVASVCTTSAGPLPSAASRLLNWISPGPPTTVRSAKLTAVCPAAFSCCT